MRTDGAAVGLSDTKSDIEVESPADDGGVAKVALELVSIMSVCAVVVVSGPTTAVGSGTVDTSDLGEADAETLVVGPILTDKLVAGAVSKLCVLMPFDTDSVDPVVGLVVKDATGAVVGVLIVDTAVTFRGAVVGDCVAATVFAENDAVPAVTDWTVDKGAAADDSAVDGDVDAMPA